MAERGRRVDIDLVEVEKLAMLHATDEEIAGWFEVTVRTIERRKSEPGFAEAIERGRAKGKLNLRRIQLKLAEERRDGNFPGKKPARPGRSNHASCGFPGRNRGASASSRELEEAAIDIVLTG